MSAGEDETKALTIKALRDAGYRITTVTNGVILLDNQVDSSNNYENDFTKNFGFVYPPTGFNLSHFVGISLSFHYAGFDGNVDGNDRMWLKHQLDGDKVRVIGQLNENDRNTKLNYLAIWQK